MVGLLLAVVLACEATGWRFARAPLAAALSRATDLPVSIVGPFRLHLWASPSLDVARLTVGSRPGMGTGAVVDAQDVSVGWRWVDLWSARTAGPVILQRLSASRLQLNLLRLKDGRSNWAAAKPGNEADTTRPLPQIRWLELQQGNADIQDEPSATQLTLTAHSSGGGQAMAVSAKGRVQNRSVDLKAQLNRVPASPQTDNTDLALALQAQGTVGHTVLAFDGQASGLPMADRLVGTIELSGRSLAAVGEAIGVTLPQSPPFSLHGQLGLDHGIWRLGAAQFKVGNSELGGGFRFDALARPPQLDGRLTGRRLQLADLGPALSGSPELGSTTPHAAGAPKRLLPDKKFNLPSLRAMDAKVAVDIAQLDLNTSALAPLSQLQMAVALRGGVLAFNDLRAQAPGGTVTGSMSLDGRSAEAHWASELAFSGIDVAKWWQIKPPEDAKPTTNGRHSANGYLTGDLSAKLRLRGSGQSTADILGSLDGQLDALIQHGTVSHLAVEAAGLDLAQGLGILLRGDEALAMRCARVQLGVQAGQATVQRGVLDNDDSTLLVTGSLSLRDETLALRALARPKDKSPFTLRAPLRVQGPWSSPQVGVETDRLALKALAAVALGSLAGPAALLPFIDLGTDAKTDPCTASQP